MLGEFKHNVCAISVTLTITVITIYIWKTVIPLTITLCVAAGAFLHKALPTSTGCLESCFWAVARPTPLVLPRTGHFNGKRQSFHNIM